MADVSGASDTRNISLYDEAGNEVGSIISKRFGPASGTSTTINTSGDNTIYTPAAGKSVRLKWIYLQADDGNGSAVTAAVKFAAHTAFYSVKLNPAKVPLFMHSAVREGAADEVLKVNLSAGSLPVLVNIDVEEF